MSGYAVSGPPVGGEWLAIDERLQLRVLEVEDTVERETGERQEILFVTSGSGALRLDGEEHRLRPGSGALLLPGERYELAGELSLVSVHAPTEHVARRGRVVAHYDDAPEETADEYRRFRVLHHGELTQFVGIVDPYRAPDHSHPYDEVGYIIEGVGVAHIGGARVVLQPGSCFYLPPGCVHCIENTGPGVMRILGVFHPAGSPKQRSYDAGA